MLIALYSKQVFNFISDRKHALFVTICAGSLFFISYLGSKKLGSAKLCFVSYEVSTMAFVLTILFFTSIVILKNPVISWLGKNVFEIYVLQRIPMILLKDVLPNKYLYFFLCMAITIITSIPFKKAAKFMTNKLLYNSKNVK